MSKGKRYANHYFNNKKMQTPRISYSGCGEVLTQYMFHPEGVLVDVTDFGINVKILINRPTNKEINQMKAEAPLEIKLLEMDNIVFFLFKFGDLNWMDAPYSVHLSKSLHHLSDVSDGTGYATTIMVIDTATGKVVTQRLYGLDTSTSRSLKKIVEKQKKNPFDKISYGYNLRKIYASYTTDQLVSLCE